MATIDSMVLGDWSPFVLIKTEFFKQTEKNKLTLQFRQQFCSVFGGIFCFHRIYWWHMYGLWRICY